MFHNQGQVGYYITVQLYLGQYNCTIYPLGNFLNNRFVFFPYFLDKSNDPNKGLSPTKSTKLSRGRPVRGNLVHSNTFTAKDIDPTNRFLTGRDSYTKNEAKRKEAVWDLFQSETAFLLDHLMVLKHVCKLFDCFSM